MTSLSSQNFKNIEFDANRLHLFASWACPFCHRILSALYLNDLQDKFSYSWMRDEKREQGWLVNQEDQYGGQHMRALYDHFEPGNEYRPSVPLLIDLSSEKIVSTNSMEITRYVTSGFNGKHKTVLNLCPDEITDEIDQLNEWIGEHINGGVYNVGFASQQPEYNEKVRELFDALDTMEQQLTDQPFLFGGQLTESDLFLFATLARFDSVYNPLFKCSIRRIADYEHLSAYQQRLMDIKEIAATIKLEKFKNHYYRSLIQRTRGTLNLNPSGIVPA